MSSTEASEPERPRLGRSRAALVFGPMIAIWVVGTIGNAIHPTLLNSHPLLLVAMEPRNRYLLLVADKHVAFWPFLLVAAVRRLASDPLYFLVGRIYGDRGVRWIERKMGDGGAVIRFVERVFGRAAPGMVFLFPGAIVCVLSGATGMPVAVFIALNVAGTLTSVAVMYRFAHYVSTPLDAVNRFYARYGKTLTIVSIVLTGIWLWNQRRTGRSEFDGIAEIERDGQDDEPST